MPRSKYKKSRGYRKRRSKYDTNKARRFRLQTLLEEFCPEIEVVNIHSTFNKYFLSLYGDSLIEEKKIKDSFDLDKRLYQANIRYIEHNFRKKKHKVFLNRFKESHPVLNIISKSYSYNLTILTLLISLDFLILEKIHHINPSFFGVSYLYYIATIFVITLTYVLKKNKKNTLKSYSKEYDDNVTVSQISVEDRNKIDVYKKDKARSKQKNTKNFNRLKSQTLKFQKELKAEILSFYKNDKIKFILSDKFYSSTDWKDVRKKRFELSENKCAKCNSHYKLEVDHIKPRSKYPELALELTNTQILCKKCNISKGVN